jgi:hypothetical protein
MPIPPGSTVMECGINYLRDGQRLLNLFHYYREVAVGSPGLAYDDAAAGDFYTLTAGDPAIMALFPTNCVIVSTSAQIVYPTRYARGNSFPNPSVPGTRAGVTLPVPIQWSLTTMGDLAGPGAHGGNRWPGPCIADETNSLFSGVFTAAAYTAVAALYADVNLAADVWSPLIYNKKFPLNSNPIVAVIVEDEVRTMRRRVVGRGK